jgi:hypothetical protein
LISSSVACPTLDPLEVVAAGVDRASLGDLGRIDRAGGEVFCPVCDEHEQPGELAVVSADGGAVVIGEYLHLTRKAAGGVVLDDRGGAIAAHRHFGYQTVVVGIGGGVGTKIVPAEAVDVGGIVGVAGLGQTFAGLGIRLVFLGTDVGVPGG